MNSTMRPARILATTLLSLSLLALAPVPGIADQASATSTPPSVKLVPTKSHVTSVRRDRRNPVVLDLGVYVTPVNGDFVLHVRRADYASPIRASQVVGGNEVPLPDGVSDGFNGLLDFFKTTLTNAAGKTVWHTNGTWCPATYARGRLNDSGPLVEPYPSYGCPYNPFTVGTVMGVSKGWAAGLSDPYGGYYGYGSSRPMYARVRDGSYTARTIIRRPYRALFSIPRSHAVVKTQVTVRTDPTCHGCYGRPGTARRVAGRAHPGARRLAATPKVPVDLTPDPSTLPDIIALPATSMYIEHRRRREFLTFGATIWNAGPSPIMVEGFRPPDADTMDAWQYFFDASGNPVGKAPAGQMHFDPRNGHGHWHFEQFARYGLTDSTKTEIVRSRKEAFCLAPTDPIDLLAPGATVNPYPIGLWSACGDQSAIWVRESLPSGWGDTYFQWLPGQSFDITNLPNGRYFVTVQVNPIGALHETDTTNDTSYRVAFLRGNPGHRRVIVPAWHGLDGPCCPSAPSAR